MPDLTHIMLQILARNPIARVQVAAQAALSPEAEPLSIEDRLYLGLHFIAQVYWQPPLTWHDLAG